MDSLTVDVLGVLDIPGVLHVIYFFYFNDGIFLINDSNGLNDRFQYSTLILSFNLL